MTDLTKTEIESLVSEAMDDVMASYCEVCTLTGGLTESLTKNIFGRSQAQEGIKIVVDDNNEVSISLRMNVNYGINIPQLSYDIQQRTKKVIGCKGDIKVRTIDIIVEGVDRSR